jgi:hypothetical protein
MSVNVSGLDLFVDSLRGVVLDDLSIDYLKERLADAQRVVELCRRLSFDDVYPSTPVPVGDWDARIVSNVTWSLLRKRFGDA